MILLWSGCVCKVVKNVFKDVKGRERILGEREKVRG